MDIRQKLIATARDFLRSKRGNVAMMFGIALVPLMIGAGAGLDFVRAMMVRQQMAEALDAAALAIGSTPGLDSTSAQALAQKYFDLNYTVDKSVYGTVTVNPPVYDAKGSVSLTATDSMPTVLMKIAGINNVPVSTTSTVVWGQTKLWVALVLDNSGSMCEPDSQPCLNDSNTASKIYQLKDATKTMLTSLQGVSTTAGDVRVAIVPFAREVDVGVGNAGASWLYWGYWEAQPANAGLNNVTDLQGPGDACPWPSSGGSFKGYNCASSATNGSSTTSTIPSSGGSSGMICPSIDDGSVNSDRMSHYYNGCYNSVATGATKQVSSGTSANCNGYTNCTCTAKSGSTPKHCDAKYYKHSWVINDHATWGGCVTDRVQNYDISITTPSSADTTGFPADNPANPAPNGSGGVVYGCMYGNIQTLEYDWTDLTAKVNALQARGSTNQAIGVAHGWEALVPSGPYGAPVLPANTTRYIILFSDGLNTQNRSLGDGHTEGTTDDQAIDTRMNLACTAAKTDGVVIYTLYVHTAVGDAADSTPLQNCATDISKYYNLSSSSQIAAAFADITKKITNVRVSM